MKEQIEEKLKEYAEQILQKEEITAMDCTLLLEIYQRLNKV